MMHFTADIDWAPEEVIEDTLHIFEEFDVPCTLFATHKSEVLLNSNSNLFEIGIHPNFNPLLKGEGGNPDTILNDLMNAYPKACGVRSHSLTQNGWLLSKFKEIGMLYELNHFMPYYKSLSPFMLWCGLLRIPFNWEDDYHFALGNSFDNCGIELSENTFSIFNFHPIHIYLNSENNNRFISVKNDMGNIKLLKENRNSGITKGTRDILIDLLSHSSMQYTKPLKMIDVYKKYTNKG